MLSVSEAASILQISSSRVRALIASKALNARKIGRNWFLEEADVMERAAKRPSAGRPCAGAANSSSHEPESLRLNAKVLEMREAYAQCRKLFATLPSEEAMQLAESPEEASFYMSVSEFFLRQRQLELVKRGVF